MDFETKRKAIEELVNLLNKYEKKGIFFVCCADDFIDVENHILHNIQIVDALTSEDIDKISYNEE